MKQATQATFLLRGINHEQLVRDYLSGKFDDLDLPKSKPKKSTETGGSRKKHVQEVGVGKDDYAAIYEKKTGAGMYRVYTTNSDAFKVYLAEISPSGDELPMKKKRPRTKEYYSL